MSIKNFNILLHTLSSQVSLGNVAKPISTTAHVPIVVVVDVLIWLQAMSVTVQVQVIMDLTVRKILMNVSIMIPACIMGRAQIMPEDTCVLVLGIIKENTVNSALKIAF